MRGKITQLGIMKSRPWKQSPDTIWHACPHMTQPYRGTEGACGHVLCATMPFPFSPAQRSSLLWPTHQTACIFPGSFQRSWPTCPRLLFLCTLPGYKVSLGFLPSKNYLFKHYYVPDTALSTKDEENKNGFRYDRLYNVEGKTDINQIIISI